MRYHFRHLLVVVLSCVLASSVAGGCGRPHSRGEALRAAGAPGRAPVAVLLADVLKQIDAYPLPKGVSVDVWTKLTDELKRGLVARSADGKTISIAPVGSLNAVTDLAAASNPGGTQATLTWTELLKGDYNNDGQVFISDLVPMAAYYMQRTDTGPDDAHKLVGGDSDPEINIVDLQAVVNNYLSKVEGYQAWRGHWTGSTTVYDPPFRPNVDNPANTAFSDDRTISPPVSARPAYTYSDDISGLTDKTNVRYKVTAYGDGSPGAESNEATMPLPPPPTTYSVSGTVLLGGSGVAGVTLALSPGGLSATTQADGTYAITTVPDGTYTLSPQGTGLIFAPVSRSVSVSGSSVTGQDFTATGGLGGSAWPKFHGNSRNTGLSTNLGAQSNVLKWSFLIGNPVESSPVIGNDGSIYIGSTQGDNSIRALSPADGTANWAHLLGGEVYSTAAVAVDGTIYVGCDDNHLYALDPADGSIKWSFTGGGKVQRSSPAVGVDGTVYIGVPADNKFFALNCVDGSVKWAFSTGGEVQTCPAIGADGTVYFGSLDGKLYAVNGATGAQKWVATTAPSSLTSPAIATDGTIYIGSDSGSLFAVDSSNGSVKWSRATSGAVYSSPAIGSDGTVYFGSWNQNVYALNPVGGSIKWTYTTGYWVGSSPAVGSDGTVYVGGYDKNFYALRPTDGSVLWSYPTGQWISSSPAIGADGTVYIGGKDGYVYAFGGGGPSTYRVNGRVVTSSNAGVGGVLMTLLPGGQTATTLSDGWYTFNAVQDGTYTLTPSASGYIFNPPSRTVIVAGMNVTVADFVATSVATLHSISGTVTSGVVGLAGVLMWLTPGGLNATTQADGTYSIPGVADGGYTLTPSKSGYAFTPPFLPETVSGADITGQDFTATQNTYSVSGTATKSGGGALAGVLMTLSPGGLNAATQADGTYTITGVADGGYTLTPTKTGYSFTPPNRSVTVSGADVSGQDFVGSTGLMSAPWPKFHQNIQNTGQSPNVGAQTSAVKWTFTAGAEFYSSPAVGADGTIYVGNYDKNVYALNPADGSVKWQHATGDWISSSPALGSDGTVYIGSWDYNVYALSPADGSVLWSRATGNRIRLSSPAVAADGTVYVGSEDMHLYALDPSDGSVKWATLLNGAIKSSPAIGLDGTVYVGCDDHNVYALNPLDGTVKWTKVTSQPVYSSPAVGADGTVYVGGWDGIVYALYPADGSVKWIYPTGSSINSSPAVAADGTVYVGCYDTKVYAIYSGGGPKWAYVTADIVESSPAIGSDGTVYIGSYDNKIYALRPADGSVLWSYTTGGSIGSSPAIAADGTVYIGSNDFKLRAFGP